MAVSRTETLGWWQHPKVLVAAGKIVILTLCPGWILRLESLGAEFIYQPWFPGGAATSDVVECVYPSLGATKLQGAQGAA